MELLELVAITQFINFTVLAPIWLAIKGLKEDIREIRENQFKN